MSQWYSAKRDCTKTTLQAQQEAVKLEGTEVQMMQQSSCGTTTLELSGIKLTNGEEIAEDRKVRVN